MFQWEEIQKQEVGAATKHFQFPSWSENSAQSAHQMWLK